MSLPGVDWISLWHIYRPFFFRAYAFFTVLIRLWLARRTTRSAWIAAWLVGSAASLLVFPLMPFLCIPAYLIVMSLTGRTVSESFFMAVPIAVSIAGCITLLDVALVRLLSRNEMRKKEVWLLFRANFLHCGACDRGCDNCGVDPSCRSHRRHATIVDTKTRRGGCPHPPGRALRGDRRAKLARPGEGTRAYVSRQATELNQAGSC